MHILIKIFVLLTLINVVIYSIFSSIYIYYFNESNDNFYQMKNEEPLVYNDILYFSAQTHMYVGFGDILPKTRTIKNIVILHLYTVVMFNIMAMIYVNSPLYSK